MPSEVDICNLGLSHFGQSASIAAIDPPDGSVEAEHAARFYPIARDEILELHPWPFAGKRATMATLTNDRSDWAYRYAIPTGCLKPRAVLPVGYGSSEDDGVAWEREGDSIYADEAGATLVYTERITDPTRFSPLFVATLGFRLASYMAGPILKDPTGKTQAALLQRSLVELAKATTSAANATRNRATHTATARRVR